MKSDCPLCQVWPEGKFATSIWTAFGPSRDAKKCQRVCQKLGVQVSESQIKTHFRHHHPIQPRPRRMSSERALILAHAQTPIRQEILRFIGRQDCVSEDQIMSLFYKGRYANINAARAACYRDLGALIYPHLLYRAPTPPKKGFAQGGGRRRGNLHLLFPGRASREYLEEIDGVEADEVIDYAKINWLSARRSYLRIEALSALRAGIVAERTTGVFLDLPVNSWYGPRFSDYRFITPVSGARARVKLDGICSLDVQAPARKIDARIPFFVLIDDGLSTPESLARRIALMPELEESLIAARMLDLPLSPPAAIITNDARRILALQRLLRSQRKRFEGRDLRPLPITDQQTLIMGSAAGWRDLWDWERKKDPCPLTRFLVDIMREPLRQGLLRDHLQPGNSLEIDALRPS